MNQKLFEQDHYATPVHISLKSTAAPAYIQGHSFQTQCGHCALQEASLPPPHTGFEYSFHISALCHLPVFHVLNGLSL